MLPLLAASSMPLRALARLAASSTPTPMRLFSIRWLLNSTRIPRVKPPSVLPRIWALAASMLMAVNT